MLARCYFFQFDKCPAKSLVKFILTPAVATYTFQPICLVGGAAIACNIAGIQISSKWWITPSLFNSLCALRCNYLFWSRFTALKTWESIRFKKLIHFVKHFFGERLKDLSSIPTL